MKLLTPKLDFIFKKLLAGDTGILTDLLNAVLGLPKNRRIRSVRVKNPVILPEEITQKYIILDILATDGTGRSYEIEMQVCRHGSYPKRALYYLSRIYAGQLESGEDYEKLKPVIGIHFLDYEMFPDNEDFHFRFEMRDVRHPKLSLTDDMSLHIFELPKFERIMKNRQMRDALGEWLHFFNHAHEEDKTMRTAYKNPAIHKAFDLLEILSADETVRPSGTRERGRAQKRAFRTVLCRKKRTGKRTGKRQKRNCKKSAVNGCADAGSDSTGNRAEYGRNTETAEEKNKMNQDAGMFNGLKDNIIL